MDDFDGFREYFGGSMKALTVVNSDEIDLVAKSPIERIFLRSLLLAFLKNDGLGLLVHPTFNDAASEVADFRVTLERFREMKAWFKEHKPTNDIATFLDDEMGRGKMSAEERRYCDELIFKYYYVPLDGSYHMSLQPRFPNVVASGKTVRPDIYFWMPTRPDINVVVECDGFAFHSDKEAFTRDRQRDRALKARGYDVLRFSGSEIFNDPVNSAHELATYLWERAR
ncbi:DUF559 domain-containing protein [Ensifer sp. LC54]|uniref:endonuclease domain-containing protein n=2 Tax=unclassified Ensifer TaxID=2633371 RepID=UPI00192A6830|nr:DUF559 domain-containing protein [Ensifer sp. LC54]